MGAKRGISARVRARKRGGAVLNRQRCPELALQAKGDDREAGGLNLAGGPELRSAPPIRRHKNERSR